MRLRIRHLRLRAETSDGLYGTDVSFGEGLSLLQAHNTSGKSTLVNSIVYCLAGDQIFGPRKEIPLPPCMLTSLEDSNGKEQTVIQSDIWLEVENEIGQILTIKRRAAGSGDRRLVSIWHGPVLSNASGIYPQEDLYTDYAGAATRDVGFEYRLAKFIGWDLPEVPRFDGTLGVLYSQCLMSLFVVEQKRGWSGIQATVPRFLQIKDVSKRVIEFVLDLDTQEIENIRQALINSEREVSRDWSETYRSATALASSVQGELVGLPDHPEAQWPPEAIPHIIIHDRNSNTKSSLSSTIKSLQKELKAIEVTEIPNADSAAKKIESELESETLRAAESQSKVNYLFHEWQSSKGEINELDNRLVSVNEEIRRYKDLKRLEKLGSTAGLNISSGHCPTCSQTLTESLLPQDISLNIMSLDQNIEYLEDQKRTLEKMIAGLRSDLEKKFNALNVTQSVLHDSHARIRILRASLTQDRRAPSLAEVSRRLLLGNQLETAISAEKRFEIILLKFSEIAQQHRDILLEKKKLPIGRLSDKDEAKRQLLRNSLIQQESIYGFDSFDEELLDIDPESFVPTRDGYNLGFDVSASDNIRLMWGYLLGLLEVSRKEKTNHPGFLILDEPQQHKPDAKDFKAFLRRASLRGPMNQQVIVATSESLEVLQAMCEGITYSLVSFPGRTLTRLS